MALTGGGSAGSEAYIRNTGNYIQVKPKTFLTLQGGSDSDSSAFIETLTGGTIYATTTSGDISLLGGVGATSAAYIASSGSDAANVTSGRDLILTGNSGATDSSAYIQTVSGLARIIGGRNVVLTGGSNVASKAFINSNSGNINLQADGYASLLGFSYIFSSTGDITVNPSGNLTLTGGSFLGSTAGIYNGIGGNITIGTSEDPIGDLTITGGDTASGDSSAYITAKGAGKKISIDAAKCVVSAGEGDVAHAYISGGSDVEVEIKAHSDEIALNGSMGGSGNSGQAFIDGKTIKVDAKTNVALNAGDGDVANAYIGYANAGLIDIDARTGGVSLLSDIGEESKAYILSAGNIEIDAPNGGVTLTASSGGASEAFIETSGTGTITIDSTGLDLTGGAAAATTAQAYIKAGNGNITITNEEGSGNINIKAGTGSAGSGEAYIETGGDITASCGGFIKLGDQGGDQRDVSRIEISSPGDITLKPKGDLIIEAGENDGTDAYIKTASGNIQIGDFTDSTVGPKGYIGALQLLGGGGDTSEAYIQNSGDGKSIKIAAASCEITAGDGDFSNAYITSDPDSTSSIDIRTNTGGVELNGGGSAGSEAYIRNVGYFVRVNPNTSLDLNGGSGDLSNAFIDTTTAGSVWVTTTTGDVNLSGGDGAESKAYIASSGTNNTEVRSGKDINLIGGSVDGSKVYIAPSGSGQTVVTSVKDIMIKGGADSIGADAYIESGSGAINVSHKGDMYIGLDPLVVGSVLSESRIKSTSGKITITSTGNLTIQGGNEADSFITTGGSAGIFINEGLSPTGTLAMSGGANDADGYITTTNASAPILLNFKDYNIFAGVSDGCDAYIQGVLVRLTSVIKGICI